MRAYKKKTTKPKQYNAKQTLDELKKNPKVRQMKNYCQHGNVSTFEHCERVAKMSVRLNRKFSLGADEKKLVEGAMLHDFFLYDWHEGEFDLRSMHGFRHAEKARENAAKYLKVDDDVQQIIYSHMFPLNITRVPKSREAWIVCFADKYCSSVETLFKR